MVLRELWPKYVGYYRARAFFDSSGSEVDRVLAPSAGPGGVVEVAPPKERRKAKVKVRVRSLDRIRSHRGHLTNYASNGKQKAITDDKSKL